MRGRRRERRSMKRIRRRKKKGKDEDKEGGIRRRRKWTRMRTIYSFPSCLQMNNIFSTCFVQL
jgi:hypothetical protein